MTNYKAVSGPDIIDATKTVWYVTFADGPNVGTRASLTGYKNEESAKRRIRDLKRKEAEASQPIPPGETIVATKIAAASIATATPNATTVAALNEAEAAANIGPFVEAAFDDSIRPATERDEITTNVAMGNEFPNPMKLAASSAYGKFGPRYPARQQSRIGVYPAISKRERRRQWNYA